MKFSFVSARTAELWLIIGIFLACYVTQLIYVHSKAGRGRRAITEHTRPQYFKMSNDVKMEVPKNNSIKVIIVGTYRGGTSVTGKLFDHLTKGFYWFEPLAGLYTSFFKKNYLRRHPAFNGYKSDMLSPDQQLVNALKHTAVEALRLIFNCKMSELPVDILLQYFVVTNTMSTNIRRAYTSCLRKDGLENVTRNLPSCLPQLQLLCSTSEIRTVKTIRLSLATIRKLLKAVPDLKVIHVVRDPRGVIQSRLKALPHKRRYFIQHVKSMCSQMIQDMNDCREIEAKYPDRIFQLRFEDLVLHPLDYASKVYSFVGVRFPDEARQWLVSNTQSTEEDGMLGLKRNASFVVLKWRNNLNAFAKRSLIKLCLPIIKRYGYVIE